MRPTFLASQITKLGAGSTSNAAWHPERQVRHVAFCQSSMQVPKVVLFGALHAAKAAPSLAPARP